MGRLVSLKPRVATISTRLAVGPLPEATPRPAGPWSKATDYNRLTGRPWRRLRASILLRDMYLCQCDECKARLVPWPADEVDHIVPLSEGGTDDPSNLRAINHDCHKVKTQRESGNG